MTISSDFLNLVKDK